ncbi:Mediator of RNA polymerase II transcription subunit 7 [Actinomortierella ambigua]|uniref:Mediator of RNA polymerase II transcription subunit 7 n=1 Tax=Actinomortierella ambigua TaxID=1343610 RepID=A0A9P6U1J6_9FUNG|nr:Mediator of RNA polymerase II transcription subunit 7 [Actinomortierella ambigua]
MEETAEQTSAFPAPPYYFKRYSKENLALLDHVKHASPSQLEQDPSIAQDIADLGCPLVALEPPPPITSGHYWQFGKPWPINDRLLTLEEQGCEQLYPKGQIDRVKELKKLNHSALFNFVELVHTLSTSPSQYAEKVEQIRLIFINMHHILNEYRPHQAKETLRLMMQDQLDRKRRETQALRRVVNVTGFLTLDAWPHCGQKEGL